MLGETEAFEDVTRLDYLLDREEKLRRLLEELGGRGSGRGKQSR